MDRDVPEHTNDVVHDAMGCYFLREVVDYSFPNSGSRREYVGSMSGDSLWRRTERASFKYNWVCDCCETSQSSFAGADESLGVIPHGKQ